MYVCLSVRTWLEGRQGLSFGVFEVERARIGRLHHLHTIIIIIIHQ
jgi:hypothetical protein